MSGGKYKDIQKHYDYNHRYAKEHYDQVTVFPPKGTKQEWKDCAKEYGVSLTQFVIEAVNEKIDREGLWRTVKKD